MSLEIQNNVIGSKYKVMDCEGNKKPFKEKGKIGLIFQKAQNGELKHAKLNLKQKAFASHAAGYMKLSDKEREQYNELSHIANSKSYNTVIQQVKEWNKKHPDCPVVSQYGIK